MSRELIRARLIVASEKLRPTDPLLADTVDEVLAPGGWKLLKPPSTTATGKNLSIAMRREVRDELKDKTTSTSLSEATDKAFEEFLAGTFVPDAPPARARRNSGVTAETVNLNVRVNGDLLQQVKDIADERSAEYGWTVTPARVAAAYLLKKHKIGNTKTAK
ncbi:hypothetical protein ACFWV1_26040 [Streptomyces sp. NPDC058700]|uniref:hypothetical protein n=1 Tax=Streptomyces sp. NPDC058700 TaxID=3346607 RepID=UPI003646D706